MNPKRATQKNRIENEKEKKNVNDLIMKRIGISK